MRDLSRRMWVGLLCSLFALLWVSRSADAAVIHEFRAGPSQRISEGVPRGSGAPLAGRLRTVDAMAADAGDLYVADGEGESYRLDKFDGSSGVFVSQFAQVPSLTYLHDGVAVAHASGDVYVGGDKAGSQEGVVAVFSAAGTLQGVPWDGTDTPSGAFGCFDCGQSESVIAVDNSEALGDWAAGDVYVVDREHSVVDVFEPKIGGGEKYVTRLEGTGAGAPFGEPRAVTVSAANGDVLVTDGNGVVDVFEPVSGMPGAYTFLYRLTGTPGVQGAPEVPFQAVVSVATDGSTGDIYVADGEARAVEQFNAAGGFLGRLTGTSTEPFHSLSSVAVDPAGGDVFVGDHNHETGASTVDVFGPSRTVPDVMTTPSVSGDARVKLGADGEGEIEATLHGTVNPLGQGPATCNFAYGMSTTFGSVAPCAVTVPEGNTPVPVSATITEGVAPDTTYSFRLQASDKNGTNPGEPSDDQQLITPGPGIHSQSAADVSSTAATLNASIDPDGASTSYYFQYGTSTAYGAEVPAAPGAPLGAGVGDVQVAPEHIQGLSPSTTYHYRVVAISQLEVNGKVQAVPFAGPDQTLTTQGASNNFSLPDGRHWELVSPPDKHGALLLSGGAGQAIQAASDGSAVTYLASSPTEEGVKGRGAGGVQVLSARGASTWDTKDISLGHATPVAFPIGLGEEYRLFSPDLSLALVEPQGEFNSLTPEAFPPDSERTPYLRHDLTCATAPGSCLEPLVRGCPPAGQSCPSALSEHADVPPGTRFGGSEPVFGEAHFIGASSDLSHVILASEVALTSTPTHMNELYEATPGNPSAQELQLVSIVTSESGEEVPAESAAHLGYATSSGGIARHAVSEDGSRVAFSSGPHLYLRDVTKSQTVQLDLPGAQCSATEECAEGQAEPHFQQASPDGSRVLFTDTQRLSSDAGKTPGTADLYQCEIQEVAGKLQCTLTDLTPAPGPGKAADVQGAVIGASEDGSWVYFVANGVLGDAAQRGASVGDCKLNGEQVEGQCNLYVEHEGATHLIARLDGADYPDWAGNSGSKLNDLTARVSPDGHYLAFMSERSLTGYDNRDAVSGQPDQEVFLYHAEGDQAGHLACASCDPSGARPAGVEAAKLEVPVVGFQVWPESTWIAANVPGWTPYELGDALYQPRYLSDSGRLFFNTDDALVTQDINANEDVYQYEPPSVGDCSGTSATFHATPGGCVALISSGRAAGESAFLDASENGDDAFFLTDERLVPQDLDTSLDLYDAHVCSSESPCLEEAQQPPPCGSAESCRVTPSPQPQVFGVPSSATFSGEGNILGKSPDTSVKPKAKPLTRAQKLAKALKACRKDRKKAKRAACEKKAYTQYGAIKRRATARSKSHKRGR